MFTGIVEGLGEVVRIEPGDGGRIDLAIEVEPEIARDVAVGDSVALAGCCLTVTRVAGSRLEFQAIPETLRMTSLGDRKPGDRLNLERAMRADARFGGHIVQGHVDGTGRVEALRGSGDDVEMRIGCGADLARLIVPKGSVTVDGVSLTVVEPDEESFGVALIPHTLAVTTLGGASVGDRVNLEVDVIGKYVAQYLERIRGPESA